MLWQWAAFLVSSEKIAGIDLFGDVVKDTAVSVGDYTAAHLLEFFQVVDHKRAEECTSVFKGSLIYDDSCSFGLYALHNALY